MKNLIEDRPKPHLRGRLLGSIDFIGENGLSGKDVLDVGCGFGWFELCALAQGGRSILGIEPIESDLATAKKHVADARVKFAVGGALALPAGDASYDVVVAWEVLEHIPKRTEPELFAEAHRVLRPGGRFILSSPHDAFWSNLLDPAWLLIGHRHYTTAQVTSFAVAAGFDVKRVEVRAGWWTLVGVLSMYVAKWIFRRGPFFEDFFDRKMDEEYVKPGFVNLFAEFRKHP